MTSISRLILISFCAVGFASGCERDNQDQRKAQHITCENNLKQIGLAFKIWAGDHGDKWPFQISTNEGGTLELCNRDAEGFDRNALAHFLVMSNELSTPKLLCCPHDESKILAADWGKLSGTNLSYRLRTDAKVNDSNPREILAVCPADGAVLYCDGSVSRLNGKPEPAGVSASYELMWRELQKEHTNPPADFMIMSNEPTTPRINYLPATSSSDEQKQNFHR
jgi:hypothetical protein